MVALLSQTGMSTRDIAPVVGASTATVKRDVRAAGESSDSPEPVEIAAGAANAAPDSEPKQITGHDGKTYTRPQRYALKPREVDRLTTSSRGSTLESGAEIPQVTERSGADGKTYPASQPAREPATSLVGADGPQRRAGRYCHR